MPRETFYKTQISLGPTVVEAVSAARVLPIPLPRQTSSLAIRGILRRIANAGAEYQKATEPKEIVRTSRVYHVLFFVKNVCRIFI